MSCRSLGHRALGRTLMPTLLLALLAIVACGRKGDPLPPLPDPDAVAAAAAAAEAAAAEAESEAPAVEADPGEDDGDEDGNEDDEANPEGEAAVGEGTGGTPP